MKLLSYVILTALLMSVGTPLVGAQEGAVAWGDPVATGIEYREYKLPDPNTAGKEAGSDTPWRGTPRRRSIAARSQAKTRS